MKLDQCFSKRLKLKRFIKRQLCSINRNKDVGDNRHTWAYCRKARHLTKKLDFLLSYPRINLSLWSLLMCQMPLLILGNTLGASFCMCLFVCSFMVAPCHLLTFDTHSVPDNRKKGAFYSLLFPSSIIS